MSETHPMGTLSRSASGQVINSRVLEGHGVGIVLGSYRLGAPTPKRDVAAVGAQEVRKRRTGVQ
jgi:hypothetical protein